jgi:acetyltransferase
MSKRAPPKYPTRWVKPESLKDGTAIVVRPIKASDAATEVAFFNQLSDHTRYQRFMMAVHELSPEMVKHFTDVDYEREMAFVATRAAPTEERPDAEEFLAVARYVGKDKTCEFAVTVQDDWQRRGLGVLLMKRLMRYARSRGYKVMQGSTFSTNTAMIDLAQKLGFSTHIDPDGPTSTLLRRKLPLRP